MVFGIATVFERDIVSNKLTVMIKKWTCGDPKCKGRIHHPDIRWLIEVAKTASKMIEDQQTTAPYIMKWDDTKKLREILDE